MSRSVPLTVLEAAAPRDARGRPLRDLRISVVDRCNFRCPYCMPEEQYPREDGFLSAAERMAPAEIERLARQFVALGVRKLRLTGGEPLLRRDLAEIVARLASIEGVEDLALTTNGVLLAPRAAELRAAGLRRLTVSLDALDPAIYARLSGGRGRVEDALAGIEAAVAAGFERIKLNTVVMRGINDGEVLSLLERYRGTGLVVRFIEYMDVGTCNGWSASEVLPSAELVERIGARWPIEPVERAYRGEVAERWRFRDGGGELGFVSSVSAPFCGDCHRARLSADGKLYTCLFASVGADLLGPLRAGAGDDELLELARRCWLHRADRYSELRAEWSGASRPRRIEMYRIGG